MPGPPDDVLQRIHDRYLTEVVEGLKLCPFARKSREQGRVHRPILRCDGQNPSTADVAQALASVARAHPDAEIVLLTLVGDDPRTATPAALDDFVRSTRAAYEQASPPRPFFMVGFHRDSGGTPPGETPPPLTQDSLVLLLRRTPDPVIQCVDSRTLERVRTQAQRAAHDRMVAELTAWDPALRPLAEHSVAADSELSADIARTNFEAVAHGAGRSALEAAIAAILADRDAQP